MTQGEALVSSANFGIKMEKTITIRTPLNDEVIKKLRVGDRIILNGIIYSARDAAHKRMVDLIKQKKKLPFNVKGQVIYYCGPSPPKPGMSVGSAGPTSSYRMDSYTPLLLSRGLKGMIGKGPRGQIVRQAIKEYKAVYFAAIGGAGALISKRILSAEVIAYPELGTEAVRRLTVKDLPVFVVNDIYGGDLYAEGVKTYAC